MRCGIISMIKFSGKFSTPIFSMSGLVLVLFMTCSLSYADSLTTLFNRDNGQSGNMFDVQVTTQATINRFDVNINYSGGSHNFSVYYRLGTSVGNEGTSSGWILLGTATGVSSNGSNVPTPLNIGGLTLNPGQVYGIFITMTTTIGYLGYTNGGPTTFSNGTMSITTNCGNALPLFSGGTFYPRQWNGAIYYTTIPTPTPPSNPGSTAIGLDTITWTWTDNSSNETGFKVYDDPGAGPPTTLRTTTAAGIQLWQHNLLNVNSQYAFQVCATNTYGDSSKTTNYTAWTLIEAVANLVFSDVGLDTITVAPTSTPSNLTSGSSGINLANTTAGTNSGWQQSTDPWVSGGLSPNTSYSFSGQSRNGGSVTTTAAIGSKYTLIEAVSGLTFSNVTPTSIEVSSTNTPSNLSSGSSGVYFTNTTMSTDSGWQQNNTPWASAGLLPNTPYTFSGKSRNGESIETTETVADKWTLAAQPLVPSVTNICSRSMAVTLASGDTNPAGTEYCLRVDSGLGGDVWVQTDGTLGAAPVYQTMPGWATITVTGLTPNTMYGVFATARNGEGVDSAVGLAGYGQTLEGVPPTATLSSTAGDPVNGAITVDVTLSENSTSFEEGDITVVDAIVIDFTGSDAAYSFTLTPTLTMPGTFSCVVLAGTFSDFACNPSEEDSNILSRSYDRWPPTLTLSCVEPYYVAGAIQVTAVSSEPTVTLEAGDIATTNAIISGFTPQPDGVTFLFQLVPGNQGLFSCYVPAGGFTDLAENANEDDSNVIERLYDSMPPTGSVVINGGDDYTTAIGVTLILSGDDGTGSGVTDMQFSNDNAAWSGWEAYAVSKAWDLDTGDGVKTVYVQYRDAAGYVSTETITDTITLDTAVPMGSVVINDGDDYTTAIGVTLTLSGDDGTGSGVADMQFSNDNAAWSGWEAYAASKAWDLATGDGVKTVYVQFRDAAGNISTQAITDTITLDTDDPVFTEITATPDTAVESDVVTLSFHGSEPLQDSPEVTVNGNAADHVSGKDGSDYVYSYTVLDPTRDPIGPAAIEISGIDLAGNPGMATNDEALTIIKLISVPIATLPMLAGLSIACAVAGSRILRRKK